MTAPAIDPFASIPAVGGGGLPGARHLEGRVVIVRPIRVDENTLGFDKKTPAPTAICDIIVVDGGPLVYGDQINNAGQQLKAPTHRIETPAMFTGWMDSHPYIVNPLRDMLRAGQPVTVGIIERGTQGNRPYFLCETHTDVDRKPRTDPQFAQRRQNAINLFNAFQTGQWRSPEPVELNPQPTAAVATNNWASSPAVAGAQPQQQYGQPAQPAAAQPLAGAQVWGAQQVAQQAQPQQSFAPVTVGPDLSVPAPGFESLWNTMSEQQKAQVWAAQPQQPSSPAVAQPVPAAPAATPWG